MRILDSLSRSPARRIGGLSLALVWAIAWIALGHHLDARAEKVRQPQADAAVATAEQNALAKGLSPGSAVQTPVYRTKKIQDIRVGERVMAHNPELTDEDRRLLGVIDPEPEPETWRKVTLRMSCMSGSGDTDHLDIELLRPLDWIDSFGAKPGRTIELDMPELDVVGPADVVSIHPCPPIKCGNGRVVTGTFAHTSGTVMNLQVEALCEPIGVTAKHRFWSEDRQAFVAAEELQKGERLRLANGELTHAGSSTPLQGVQRVFNLEVHGEHTFLVTRLGILAHNTYEAPGSYLARKAPHQVRPGIRVLEGKYVNDLGRVEPWRAHYDEFGRLIARTDFNAGNIAAGIPDVHFHLFEWLHGNPMQLPGHFPGVFIP